jgi:hypothetical protein
LSAQSRRLAGLDDPESVRAEPFAPAVVQRNRYPQRRDGPLETF